MLSTQNIQNNRLVVDFFRGLPASSNNVIQIQANMIMVAMLRRQDLRVYATRHWVVALLLRNRVALSDVSVCVTNRGT